MYAADIYFWRKYRVNYPFIFGFKRGTELGYREVFLLSTGLAVLALAGLLANLHLDMDPSTQKFKKVTELVPLALVTVRLKNQLKYPLLNAFIVLDCVPTDFLPFRSLFLSSSTLSTSYTEQVVSSSFDVFFAAYLPLYTRYG